MAARTGRRAVAPPPGAVELRDRGRGARLEPAAALLACALAALLASRRLLEPGVFSQDAFVHQYWMWSFRDPELFTDPLTHALRESARYPPGYQALFWLPVQLASPITVGEWLGVALMAVSGWLVFLIVRDHEAWKPAAWAGAALFLALIDIHRFHGGFQRAFVHPVVLLTVLLSMRGRVVPAAAVAAGSALVYPPAALLALGVLAFCAVGAGGGRLRLDRRRALAAAGAGALAAVAVLAPALAAGGAPSVLTASEARRFPDFGPRGGLHFFVPGWMEYLRQNRSGFDLRASGSLLLLAAAVIAVAAWPAVRRLRREVLALPVVALLLYVAAQLVLFRLYLPHRYTYPLVAFAAIAVAVGLRPAWERVAAGGRPWRVAAALCVPVLLWLVARHGFPLGPRDPFATTELSAVAALALVAAGAAVASRHLPRRDAALGGAALTAALLVGLLTSAAGGERGFRCPDRAATAYLAGLPEDAIVAGDPTDLECIPATTRRAVVISSQLAPSYEPEYFRLGRERMSAMLRGYYGPSLRDVAALHDRYGATALWIRRNAIERELRGPGVLWPARRLPFGREVRALARAGSPASLRLPAACRRFRSGAEEVYDLACVARAAPR